MSKGDTTIVLLIKEDKDAVRPTILPCVGFWWAELSHHALTDSHVFSEVFTMVMPVTSTPMCLRR